MIAIIVLTALMLLAIPFAAFMRRQHASGTQALHSARAKAGEAGALGHAQAALGLGQPGAENDANPFPYNDPNVDTLWEFRVTLRTQVAGGGFGTGTVSFAVDDALGLPNDGDPETVDGYIRVDGEWMAYSDLTGLTSASTTASLDVNAAHRGLFGTAEVPHAAGAIVSFFPDAELWTLDVEDPQSKININTAPYRVIRNLLGYLRIGDDAGGPAPVPGDAAFPNIRQQAITAAIVEYRSQSCIWENWDGFDDIPDGTYTPFQNVDMLKSISLARDGVGNFIWDNIAEPPLSAEEMDLLRPHITVNSGYATAGASWLGVANLESDMMAAPVGGATNLSVANLSDASRIGVGSTVWFEWPDTSVAPPIQYIEYRTVLAKNGCGRPLTLHEHFDSGNPTDELKLRFVPGFVGASASTPCYIKIDDEWIEYTGVSVDAAAGTMTLTGWTQDPFGTGMPPQMHQAGISYVDGDVICWENTLALTDDPPPLIGPLSADCLVADEPVIQVQNRHGINVNTCTDPIVLQSLFYDIDRYGSETFDTAAVDRIATETTPTSGPQGLLPRLAGGDEDFFDGDEDWFDGDGTSTAQGELDQFFLDLDTPLSTAQEAMLAHNANALTVPLQFNSGALLGLGSLAVADDRAGTPVAQSPNTARLARLFDVVPPLTESLWQWRSQKEFYEHILATGGGKNVLTMPLNEGLLPPDPTTHPSDYAIYADTRVDTGTVTAALEELNPTVFTTLLEGLHESPPEFSPDYSVAADSRVTASAPRDFDNTANGGIGNVHLQYPTNYSSPARQRHIEADSFHATLQPFAIEFWVKADTGFVADIGIDPNPTDLTARNQIRLRLESGTLVLRMDDEVAGTGPLGESFGGYVEARSSPGFSFDAADWHHVAVAVCGTFRNEIAMFIDGIYDENMDWSYHYLDATGLQQSVDETTVTEGYFWPLAMEVPNQRYSLAANAVLGETVVTLSNVTGLPHLSGRLAIGSATNDYAYIAIADSPINQVTLATPLNEGHSAGEAVAFMLPVVRPVVHRDAALAPALNDQIGLWAHTDLGNGSFRSNLASTVIGPETVQNVVTGAAYRWLGIDPNLYPLGGTAGTFFPDERWHVVDYDEFIANPSGALSGGLPSGTVGTDFSVGADRNGSLGLSGMIDEFRITTLPTALVEGPLTLGGSSNATLRQWEWFISAAVDPAGWLCVRVRDGASAPWLPAVTWPPATHTSGGYFVGPDTCVYSYEIYEGNVVSPIGHHGDMKGIQRLRPDLVTDAGTTAVAAGPHRLMPLSFITSTRLWAAFAPADDHIQVVDASQFPRQGYVKIDDEIIGYCGKDTSGSGFITPHLLLRPTAAAGGSPYPRGAYGTTEAGHAARTVVRHLPVRHLDRYREEDPGSPGAWTQHVNYSEAQLDAQMCMVSFPVYRAGKLNNVSWQLREPLEDGQKVAVLVRIDDAVAWNIAPEGDLTIGPEEVDGSDSTSNDLLWGTIIRDGDPAAGSLDIYHVVGGVSQYPTATSKVEVRFYFDLGETHPFNTGYDSVAGNPVPNAGWTNMIEIDEVTLEMLPESVTY